MQILNGLLAILFFCTIHFQHVFQVIFKNLKYPPFNPYFVLQVTISSMLITSSDSPAILFLFCLKVIFQYWIVQEGLTGTVFSNFLHFDNSLSRLFIFETSFVRSKIPNSHFLSMSILNISLHFLLVQSIDCISQHSTREAESCE